MGAPESPGRARLPVGADLDDFERIHDAPCHAEGNGVICDAADL